MSVPLSNRVVVWSAVVVGALLLVAIGVGVTLLTTMSAQADENAYRQCMAQLDNGGPSGGIEDYATKRAADAAACSR